MIRVDDGDGRCSGEEVKEIGIVEYGLDLIGFGLGYWKLRPANFGLGKCSEGISWLRLWETCRGI